MGRKYEFTGNTIVNEDGVTVHQIRAVRSFGKVKAGDLGGFIAKESNLSHEGNCWVYEGGIVFWGAVISGTAIVIRGYISGGLITGGDIRGGTFYGGDIRGGTFYGGLITGGVFHGGTFYDGMFYDGMFYGGTFYGGMFYGGTFYGGMFYGGVIRGGVIYRGKIRGGLIKGEAEIVQDNQFIIIDNVGTKNGTLTVYKGKDGLLATMGCFFGTTEEFLEKAKEFDDEKTLSEYERLIEVAKSRILG